MNVSAMPVAPPTFLQHDNPAEERFREACELFSLFDYLRAQGFGVFSIRESLQAVGECRDGTLQGFALTDEDVWQTVCHLDALGVGVVELPAWPANPYGQQANRRLLERAAASRLRPAFAAHARCHPDDLAAARAAGFRRLHLYIGTSPIKQATTRRTIGELAHQAGASIVAARAAGFTTVRISTEDAFRTTLDDYRAFYAALQHHLALADTTVDGIGIPDTVGVATIGELGQRIAVLRELGITFAFLECHIHNDIGNADRMYVDTLLLAQRLGIRMVPDLAILGIGERNGTIGLSSLLEAIYRRLIALYPARMPEIRSAMRTTLGTLDDGALFVNRYRDMDAGFYRILARTGFVFDRSPFSANTEVDGSGVHADTTMRAHRLALAHGHHGQAAIDAGNRAYAGALPPYDMPLRVPALACAGCGKSNVRYWRERLGWRPRDADAVRAALAWSPEAPFLALERTFDDEVRDDIVARLIRLTAARDHGISHARALELLALCYHRDPVSVDVEHGR